MFKKLLILLFLCAASALHAANYLTFTAEEDGSSFGIDIIKKFLYEEDSSSAIPDVQYSLDGGKTWTKLPTDTFISLKRKGDKALLRGNNPQGFSDTTNMHTQFVMTGRIAACGSVMSLIDNVGESVVIPNKWCFNNLFRECSSLTKAPELPATQLTEYCYFYMFSGCKSLKEAPELRATKLEDYCYESMFRECIRLIQAPKLPATKLAEGCYEDMFSGCIQLTQAPELPATTLAEYCYYNMFSGCIRLAQAPQLPATTLAYNCYYNMFEDCISLPNAPYPSDTCVASPANKKLYGYKKSGKGPMDTMYICRTNNDTIHVGFEKVSIVHKYSFGRQFKRINDNKLRIKTEGHKNNFLSCEECKITRYSVDQKVDIAFLTGIDLKTNPTDEIVHLRTTSQDGELISEITIILYPEPTLYLKINDSIVKIDSTVPMPSFNEKDDIRLIAMTEDGRDLKVIEHRWGYMDGHHVRPVCGCDLFEIIKGNQINPKHLKRMIGSGEEKIWFYFRYYDRHLNRVFQSGRPFFNTGQTSPNTD